MTVQEIKSLDFDKLMYEVRMRLGFLKELTRQMDPEVPEERLVLEDLVQPNVFLLVEFCMNIQHEEDEEEDDAEVSAEEEASGRVIPFGAPADSLSIDDAEGGGL
jgi:hypothetical protein